VVALDGLSTIVNQDLARDLSRDIYAMLNHSRAHIRKRAILVLYKIFLRYPGTLEQNFTRLKEKLEDPDPGMPSLHRDICTLMVYSGVVSATVNVLCELARLRPRDYLPLAPLLFHLLQTSTNNWMLIKIIKLVGSGPIPYFFA
jgi:AP-3 complex subunit delta